MCSFQPDFRGAPGVQWSASIRDKPGVLLGVRVGTRDSAGYRRTPPGARQLEQYAAAYRAFCSDRTRPPKSGPDRSLAFETGSGRMLDTAAHRGLSTSGQDRFHGGRGGIEESPAASVSAGEG